MKLSIGKINYICGIVFGILTYLVIPIEYERLCLIPIIVTIILNFGYVLVQKEKIDSNVIIVCAMLAYTILLMAISEYRQDYVFRAWLTLLMIVLISMNGVEHVSKRCEFVIWALVLSLLIYRAIVSPRMYEGTGSPVFQTAFYDRIETELCIILFMYYSVKNAKITGIIYSFAYYVFLSSSRGTLLMLIMFFGIRYGKHFAKRYIENKVVTPKRKKRLLIYAIFAFALYILFCYYWIYFIADDGVVSHGAGLNDTSNFTRFASTIYSIRELMLKHNLLLSGFGSELRNVMGISEGNYAMYMGQWLVQSHNSILNLLLCFGYIPGILYLVVFFNLIKKYFSFANLEYILGFILYTFIIVLIAKKGLDCFWLYILMIPEIQGLRIELLGLSIRSVQKNNKYMEGN